MYFYLTKLTREMGDVVVAQFVFQLAGIPMLLVIFPFVSASPVAGVGGLSLLIGLGILTTFSFTLYLHALKIGNLAVIAPLQNARVLITVALAVIVLKETVSPLRALGIVGVLIGVILLAIKLKSGVSLRGAEFYRGVLPAAIAITGLGFYQFFGSISARWNDWYYTSLVIRIVIPTAIGAMFLVTGKWREWRAILRMTPWRLVAVASFLDVVGFSSFNFAVSRYDVSYVSVIVSASPAVSVLFAVTYLHERLSLHQKIGLALAVAGVAVLNI